MTSPSAPAFSISLFMGAVLLSAAVPARSDTTIPAQKDSYIKSGQSNRNEGANHVLRVDRPGKNRTLVGFPLSGIDPSQVVSATLELTVSAASSWGPGRPVGAHRLNAAWTEGNGWNEGGSVPGTGTGVTWNCASDTDVSNDVANCAAPWNGGTFAPLPTAVVVHTNNLAGTVVRFNVTADVAALSSGATEISWILKKQDENADGRADYISKEAAINLGNPSLAPRLVLVGLPNRPPTANLDTVVVRAGEPSLIDVLANDFDPDGDALSLLTVGPPAFVVDNKVGLTVPAGNHVVPYTIQDADASPFTVSGLLVVGAGAGETRVLTAVADSFLKQGSPNENQGASSRLHVSPSDRTVASFDLTGIDPVTVLSAKLELRVVKSQSWGTAGRYVAAHRLLEPYVEGNGTTGQGVTWNCAADLNLANTTRDCTSSWSGGHFGMRTALPFLQKNTTSGVVRWDVTQDVRGATSSTVGFLVKKVDEGADGLVHYDSRTAGGTPPRLALELIQLSAPLPDVTSPIVTAPASIVVAAVDQFGTPRSSSEIFDFLSSATAIDDEDPLLAVNHDAPDPLPLGTTVITFYATDASGNTGSDSASITVEDQTPPVITPPISITVNSPDGEPVRDTQLAIAAFLLSARARDNVDGFLPLTHDAPSQFFPETTTVVHFASTDAAGNTAEATATVAVTHIIITPTPEAGQNVNMVSGQEPITGDPFLQRQNEPSLAVSTRNPMHILGGSNDYRTVDFPGNLDDLETGDAWLGVFKSIDGGEKWVSTLIPGFPQDTSLEAQNSPLRGYRAGADPVVRSGAGGIFYYAGLVFDRGIDPKSRIFVARFVDKNNEESTQALQYVDATAVDSQSGPAAEFLDKPWMAVDIPRSGAIPCQLPVPEPDGIFPQTFPGGNLYVAYAAVANGGTAQETSRILFRRSTDCGANWSDPPIQISAGTKGQGASMAIDPRNGKLYVAWRRFAFTDETNAILIRASMDGGQTFGPVSEVRELVPFDQQTIDQPGTRLRFRTNAYPTMAVDGEGRVYLAFSARGFAPTTSTDGRIVVTTSPDGLNWTPAFAVDNNRGLGHQMMPTLAFAAGKLFLSYYDFREDISGTFENFVDDTPINPDRHTVDVRIAMAVPDERPVFTIDSALSKVPSVRASKYTGSFNESIRSFEQEQFNFSNLPLFQRGTAPFIGDYVDVAAAPPFVPAGDGTWRYNLDPNDSPVFQLAWTDNRDVRPPTDGNWAAYTPPNTMLGGTCTDFNDAGMRDQNIYTTRVTEGLYVGSPVNTKPLVDENEDSIQRSFILFVQNTTNELRSYRLVIANQPPDAPRPVGRASFKQFPLPPYDTQSEPPVTQLLVLVPPRSSIARTVYVTSTIRFATIRVDVIETAIPGTSFVPKLQRSVLLNPDLLNPDLLNPDLLNPETHNVAITNVLVSNPLIKNDRLLNPDLLNPDLLNPDLLNPRVVNPDLLNPDLLNPDLLNPDLLNPDLLNTRVMNPDLLNPDLLNPDLLNPDLLNTSLTDVTYTIENQGNTATTFTFVGLLAKVPARAFKYQILIYKKYTTPMMDETCELEEREHHELVANITGVRNPDLLNPDLLNPDLLNPDLLNPDLLNPDLLNPDLLNPDLLNPDLLNAAISDGTFYLGQGEEAYVTMRTQDLDTEDGVELLPEDFTPVVVSQTANTEDAEEGFRQGSVASDPGTPLSIFTPALPQGTVNVEYHSTLLALGANGTAMWTQQGLPAGQFSLDGSTGQISGNPTAAGVYSVVVTADDGSEIVSKNLTLEVTSNQLVFTTQPVDALAGTALLPAVAVSIRDGAGNPLPTASDVVTLAIGTNNGGGTLFGTATQMAIDGIATFPGLSIDKAGTGYTLFATSPGLKSALSHPFDITGTSPTGLGFLLQPPSATALQPFSVQVAVLDNFGNVHADASDPITLSLGTNPGGATLYGPSTANAVNGIATFQELGIAIDATGYTLIASAAGLTPAVSNSFDIHAVPPAKLAFQVQPSNIDAGFPMSPTLEVVILDASDNPVTTATNLVTLAISSNPGGGSLSGTTSVEAVNGVASFPGVSIDRPGDDYFLVALSAGLEPATSTTFDVGVVGPFAYVGNFFDFSISVIDLGSNSVVAEIPLGFEPFGKIAVSADGNTVYVLKGTSLIIIDAQTNQVVTTVPIGGGTNLIDLALMPDGNTLYLADSLNPGSIHVFDTVSRTVTQTIPVDDSPNMLALTPFGDSLYVGHLSGALTIITTAANAVSFVVPGGLDQANALAISPDGTLAYMTDASAGTVVVFETATRAVVASIPVGGSPQGVAFTHVNFREAYVPNLAGAGYVSVIDTQVHAIVGNIVVGFAPRQVTVSPDGARVYVTNQDSNTVSVIDTSTDAVVDTVNVGAGPNAIAVKRFEILTSVVTTVADSGAGSLRQAFLDANTNPGPDYIDFDIPGPGPHTISPLSPLPALTSPVVLDATTEPDYAGTPIVEIEGSSAGASAVGIELGGGSSTVRGFVVNRFGGAGILLSGGGNNRVENNFIGVDVTGSVNQGNGTHGVLIDNSRNNVIGGLVRNVISGNGGPGIAISGSLASGNSIHRNLIGTDDNGSSFIPNNGGIRVSSPRNVIGIANTARNIISGNSAFGIRLDFDADQSVVQGNFIGTDVTGNLPLGNGNWGLEVYSDGNTIGGTSGSLVNVISANGSGGVRVAGINNVFSANFIGTDAALSGLNLGNLGPGIEIDGGSNNTFGSLVANQIRYNTGDGVVILAGERNLLTPLNVIHSNDGLGIDLGGDGVTANDAGGDPDTGPNTLLNFPVLTSATAAPDLNVTGTFHSAPTTQFNLFFFTTTACDPSGNGEGGTFIGSSSFISNPSGNIFINRDFPGITATGLFITARATDELGNSSEFSNCIPVTVPGTITFDNIISPAGTVAYDGDGGPAFAASLGIETITGTGTAQNDGTSLPCLGCVLSFQTGANLTEGATYSWAAGGTFTITGSIPALGIGPASTILSGTFTSATADVVGSTLVFASAGTDTKAPELVEFFYGLSGPSPSFEFNFSVIGSPTVLGNLGFTMDEEDMDISNSIP
jgi:YVTN family beta-propeller protein